MQPVAMQPAYAAMSDWLGIAVLPAQPYFDFSCSSLVKILPSARQAGAVAA